MVYHINDLIQHTVEISLLSPLLRKFKIITFYKLFDNVLYQAIPKVGREQGKTPYQNELHLLQELA